MSKSLSGKVDTTQYQSEIDKVIAQLKVCVTKHDLGMSFIVLMINFLDIFEQVRVS